MAKKSQRVLFDIEDYEFIQEYRSSHGVEFQTFVREAVKKKIEEINVIEVLRNLEQLKK